MCVPLPLTAAAQCRTRPAPSRCELVAVLSRILKQPAQLDQARDNLEALEQVRPWGRPQQQQLVSSSGPVAAAAVTRVQRLFVWAFAWPRTGLLRQTSLIGCETGCMKAVFMIPLRRQTGSVQPYAVTVPSSTLGAPCAFPFTFPSLVE